jgi:hypothetical protein
MKFGGYVKMKAKTKGLQTEKSATLGVSSGWSATQNLFSLGAFGHNYPFKGRFYHGELREIPRFIGACLTVEVLHISTA